jgi:hypothetical protein
MALFNAAVAAAIDALLFPFHRLPALTGLTWLSLLTAAMMLIVFKRTSRQDRLYQVKRRIHAALFEMRLFADDLPALFRAQGEILAANAGYLRLSFVPVLWMAIPLFVLFAELQSFYGYTGLTPGEPAIVKASLRDGAGGAAHLKVATGKPLMRLEAPDGLRVETPALWIPDAREVDWRIGADRPGEYLLKLHVGGSEITKAVRVSDAPGWRSPFRVGPGLLNRLLYPLEPPLADSLPIGAIEVVYPARRFAILGWHLSWLVVFLALTMVFALLLRRPFGVVL